MNQAISSGWSPDMQDIRVVNSDLKRLVTRLKVLSNPRALRALITKVHADRGRERYRRAGITASTSFLSKALTIIISFASVPLTVHYLGAERYGVWLVISSLLTWMSLTDFGLAGNGLVNLPNRAERTIAIGAEVFSLRFLGAHRHWYRTGRDFPRHLPFNPMAACFSGFYACLNSGTGAGMRLNSSPVRPWATSQYGDVSL
jgi:hypothetical protein